MEELAESSELNNLAVKKIKVEQFRANKNGEAIAYTVIEDISSNHGQSRQESPLKLHHEFSQ